MLSLATNQTRNGCFRPRSDTEVVSSFNSPSSNSRRGCLGSGRMRATSIKNAPLSRWRPACNGSPAGVVSNGNGPLLWKSARRLPTRPAPSYAQRRSVSSKNSRAIRMATTAGVWWVRRTASRWDRLNCATSAPTRQNQPLQSGCVTGLGDSTARARASQQMVFHDAPQRPVSGGFSGCFTWSIRLLETRVGRCDRAVQRKSTFECPSHAGQVAIVIVLTGAAMQSSRPRESN